MTNTKDNKQKSKNSKKIKLNKNQTIGLYQNKERELQKISQRLNEVQKISNEINKAEKTLQELEKIKTKDQVMVNIGAGVLMPCEVKNDATLKVMLPGSIIVDKKVKDVLKDLEGRKKELDDAKDKLVKAYKNTSQILNSIKQALQKMAANQNDNSKAPTNVN